MTEDEAMAHDESEETAYSPVKSWLIVVGIALLFTVWGLMIFFVVGDKGSPIWDFAVVEDIPGQSSYSTSSPVEFPTLIPYPVQKDQVFPQHVMGRSEEKTVTPEVAPEVEGGGDNAAQK